MPYISLRTTETFENQDTSALAKEITENMSRILSKGSDTIMLDLQSVNSLFMGGTKVDKGAVVEIKVFGEASSAAKRSANDFLVKFLGDKLGISAGSIYVIYFDKKEWGYKGSFLS